MLETYVGVSTLAGRKSILKLAQRMTWSFCRSIGASSYNTWSKVTSKTGEDIRISSRKNLNDPGEPTGTIVCAVTSILLPIPPRALFDFLRDETRYHEVCIIMLPSLCCFNHCIILKDPAGDSISNNLL